MKMNCVRYTSMMSRNAKWLKIVLRNMGRKKNIAECYRSYTDNDKSNEARRRERERCRVEEKGRVL